MPRPAMLVAIVTCSKRPAWAMMLASASWLMAFSTLCLTPAFLSSFETRSDFSTDVVPTSTGWPALVALGDLLDHGVELLALALVDHVGVVGAAHDLVRRHHHDVELVGLLELDRLGVGRAGHAAELRVHAEVVLDGDGGERLVLALDLHALLRLDRLVQPVRPAPARHEAAGELVDDDDLAVLHHVVDVALEERVRLQRLRDVVQGVDLARVVEVRDAEQPLALRDALLREHGVAVLLVDRVVDLAREARDDAVHRVVELARLLGRARR